MILIPVLIASTACTSTEIVPDYSYAAVIAAMMPELPEIPSFPELSWEYADGRYSISEADVDRLLDYGENQMPLYRWQIGQYRRSMDIIRQALLDGPSEEQE